MAVAALAAAAAAVLLECSKLPLLSSASHLKGSDRQRKGGRSVRGLAEPSHLYKWNREST